MTKQIPIEAAKEFSEKFEFPNYFSFNFNALDKMLEDL